MDRLIVAVLATWRLCSLLQAEQGPFYLFLHVRTFASRYEFARELLGCIYCLSVWVGALCAVIALSDVWWVLVPFALSAGAICFEQVLKLMKPTS